MSITTMFGRVWARHVARTASLSRGAGAGPAGSAVTAAVGRREVGEGSGGGGGGGGGAHGRGRRERGAGTRWALGMAAGGASLATVAVLAKDDGGGRGRDMTLYWGSGSPPCWRVMITLAEKQLHNYRSVLLSMGDREHKTADMKKLNPRLEVPVFRHGDLIVNESLAICDYLEYVFSGQGHQLQPTDPAQRALVLQRQNEVQNIQGQISNGLIIYMWSTKAEDRTPSELQAKKDAFHKELSLWESYIKQGDSKCQMLAGSTFSMADAAFFPVLALFVRMGLRLAPRYPNLQEYYDRLCTRPSIQATWPPHWRNSPPGNMLEDV